MADLMAKASNAIASVSPILTLEPLEPHNASHSVNDCIEVSIRHSNKHGPYTRVLSTHASERHGIAAPDATGAVPLEVNRVDRRKQAARGDRFTPRTTD